MYKNNKVVKRYSVSFKLKILNELSKGELSKTQLGKLYGVSPSTINEWMRTYDRKDLMNTRILVENIDEISRLKALKKEVEQLKNLLVKKDLEKLMTTPLINNTSF
jgi:transposase-like protein